MACSQCVGIESQFGDRSVRRELRRYRRKGPGRPTRLLIEALEAAGPAGTLLDIGGGVGGLQHALLEAGVSRATAVDASSAYLDAAREEANRRGLGDRLAWRHGDFLDLAAELPRADIVTLDKVICCYPDVRRLAGQSADLAARLWGAVYPRNRIIHRIAVPLINLAKRLQRSPFRVFLHPPAEIESLLLERGFTRRSRRTTVLWEVAVWERARPVTRPGPAAAPP